MIVNVIILGRFVNLVILTFAVRTNTKFYILRAAVSRIHSRNIYFKLNATEKSQLFRTLFRVRQSV